MAATGRVRTSLRRSRPRGNCRYWFADADRSRTSGDRLPQRSAWHSRTPRFACTRSWRWWACRRGLSAPSRARQQRQRSRSAFGVFRHIRRRVVLGHAAYSRIRHPHGSWRDGPAARRVRGGQPAWRHRDRRRRWSGCGRGPGASRAGHAGNDSCVRTDSVHRRHAGGRLGQRRGRAATITPHSTDQSRRGTPRGISPSVAISSARSSDCFSWSNVSSLRSRAFSRYRGAFPRRDTCRPPTD